MLTEVSEATSGLTAFPVPAGNELFVKASFETEGTAVLTILTVQGKVIYYAPASQLTKVDTSMLEPGVYFVQIRGRNGFQKMARFVKN